MNELPFGGSDRVLLRLSDVENMRNECKRLEEEVRERQGRIHLLRQKLEAAELLAGIPAVSKQEAAPEDAESGEDESGSLASTALLIVLSSGRLMSNQEIRRELEKFDDFRDRLKQNPNYFYTVMKRHVDRGRLKKVEGKYGAPDQS